MQPVEAAIRQCHAQVLATLIRIFGDFDLAEDALQTALAKALEAWPRDGLPNQPAAWLITTARRGGIDQIRRRQQRDKHAPAILAAMPESDDPWETMPEERLRRYLNDDLLRLIFTCCHPALAPETQIALTLKTILGFSVEEVGRALLVGGDAMEQRLTRAKRKIQAAGISYEVPAPEDTPERLRAVLKVIYLIFNEGYSATAGDRHIRADLCEEAIRLARLIVPLYRQETEIRGLLALMLLQYARFEARESAEGNIILLADQDRRKWNRRMINEATAILDAALYQKRPGPYQIQAAIAALHSETRNAENTDWPQIAGLYERLCAYDGNPVIRINYAVALSQTGRHDEAHGILLGLGAQKEIKAYHPYYVALGHVLDRLGKKTDAQAAYHQAVALCRNPREHAFLRSKLS